jgi:DNA-binding transcriptional LysR family regulator
MNKIDLSRINLNLLVTFEMLMAERHVGRAARRLEVGQSAVSHALGRLRELFNDPLFVRHPKGIEPTKLAIAVGVAVSDVLDRTRTLLEARPSFDPAQGHRFVIGLTDASAAPFVRLVERLRSRWPKILLRVLPVDSGAVVAAVDRQDVDLALSLSSLAQVPSRIERVTALTLHYVCLRRRRESSGAPLDDQFLELPHLAISPRGESSTLIDDLLAELGLRRNVMLTVPHFLLAPMVVARSDLISIMDNSIAKLFCEHPNLEALDLPFSLPRVTIDILWAAGRAEEPALSWLRDECLTVCREMMSETR